MTDDLTGMYDDSSSLDQRIEIATHLLKQAADEQNVDLDDFSEEDLSNMITEMVSEDGDQGGEDDGDYEGQGDGGEGGEGKTAGDITVADVALELTKRASAQGVDLSDLDPDVYSEIFDKVAMEMTSPEFVEEQQKLAEQIETMDQLGRIAARGFVDEINKLAADDDGDHRRHRRHDDDDEEEVDIKVKKAALKDHARKAWNAAKGVGGKTVNAARSAGARVANAERSASEHVGRRTSRQMGPQTQEAMRSRGRKVMGGVGGTLALTGGGAAVHGRRKKASLEDAAAVADAIDILRAAGYDL